MEVSFKYQEFTHNRYSATAFLNKKPVGQIDGNINIDGKITCSIKVNQGFERQGIGYVLHEKIINELSKLREIKVFESTWLVDEEFQSYPNMMSTNLLVFLECLENDFNLNDCAFYTPTGKILRRLGFKTCEVLYYSESETKVNFYL